MDGYLLDDVPPGIKLDYFAELERIYPDGLCVGVNFETGFITIKAPPNRGGNFVTCGVTGVGAVELIRKSETITIAGQSYTASGFEMRSPETTATPGVEVFWVGLTDGIQINYGRGPKQMLHEILASYQQVRPANPCAANWTRLYPGLFAVVAGELGDPSNRVRSAPSTDASVIARIYPGEFVLVLEGPTCANNLVFWKIKSAATGSVGWTAEGDGAEYYLAPYNP